MKKFSFFSASLSLSINRYIGRIGSMVMMVILGHYDKDVLAAFLLLVTGVSIFFMAAISGQISLQSEFARLKAQNQGRSGLLAGSIMLFGGLASCMYLAVLLLGADYFFKSGDAIFQTAKQSFSLLAISIPLLALNNILAMFLEGHGYAFVVSIVRIGQVLCGLIAAAVIALFFELSLFRVIFIYVILDATALSVLAFYLHKKQLVSFLNLQFSNIKQVLRPFKIGIPASLGQAATTFATFKLTSLVAGLDSSSVATLGTIMFLTFLIQILIIGVSQQVGLEVAKQHSLKQPIWASMKKGSIIILVIMCVSILGIFFGRSIFGSMVAHDPATKIIFVQSIVSILFYLTISAVSLYLINLLRACGDYTVPQIVVVLFGALGFVGWITFIKQPISLTEILNTYIAFNGLSSAILLGRFLYLNQKNVSH